MLAKRREARKEMERERKKAIKAAYRRLRDAKKKPDDVSNSRIHVIHTRALCLFLNF